MNHVGLMDLNASLNSSLSLSASQRALRRLNSEYARQMSVISHDEHGLEDVYEVGDEVYSIYMLQIIKGVF